MRSLKTFFCLISYTLTSLKKFKFFRYTLHVTLLYSWWKLKLPLLWCESSSLSMELHPVCSPRRRKKIHTFLSLTQVRRGSEPALHKNSTASDLNVAAPVTTGSVQATIAAINAKLSTSSQVPRSLSASNGLTIPMAGSEHNLRSSLRKTMVNTTYSVPLDHQDRSNQQSSPDSQYDGDAGSLSVMRRREPLGASGNKPERPK